jgi:hypothetical protein
MCVFQSEEFFHLSKLRILCIVLIILALAKLKVSSAKTKMLFSKNVSDALAHSISHICGFWED